MHNADDISKQTKDQCVHSGYAAAHPLDETERQALAGGCCRKNGSGTSQGSTEEKSSKIAPDNIGGAEEIESAVVAS